METAPIKIYLDQKDYSRTGKGLSGEHDYDDDVRVYNLLLELVKSNKIRIYFSWCHINEAMRYDEQKIDLLEPYCAAIDSLTQGHCIRWVQELEKKELELFLCNQFNFKTDISEESYPYGKYKDAVPFPDDIYTDLDIDFDKAIEKQLKKYSIPNELRKIASRYLANRQNLRAILSEISKEDLHSIGSMLPGFDLSKDDLINIACGDMLSKKEVLQTCFNKTMTFKNLVHYSRYFPDLKQLGSFFDEDSEKLKRLIKGEQALHTICDAFNIPHMNETDLRSSLIEKFVDDFDDDLTALYNKYRFPVAEAKEILLKSELRELPSMNAIITFGVEYYKRHKGDYDRGRTPLRSDIMDLHHVRNLPYVDFYSTDRFFGEVVRAKSKEFTTRVVTNLKDLKSILLTRA